MIFLQTFYAILGLILWLLWYLHSLLQLF